MKLLTYLKKKLGCGSITPAGKNCSSFRIRNPVILRTFILPLLKNQLLTVSKRWDFVCMEEALDIYRNPDLTLNNRNNLLLDLKLKRKQMPENFVEETLKIQEKPCFGWILGFTEREGSFYITKKNENRMAHGFGYTQNFEKFLLEKMAESQGWNIRVKQHVYKK